MKNAKAIRRRLLMNSIFGDRSGNVFAKLSHEIVIYTKFLRARKVGFSAVIKFKYQNIIIKKNYLHNKSRP